MWFVVEREFEMIVLVMLKSYTCFAILIVE